MKKIVLLLLVGLSLTGCTAVRINTKDIIKYSMDNDLIKDVIEDASTISMFSNKKIIILEECNFLKANKSIDDIELLEKYLNNYNKDTYMIFISYTDKLDTRKKIYKGLSKIAKIRERLAKININLLALSICF